MDKTLMFSYLVLFILGLIGCIFVGTVLHEYQHMRDFRNTNITLDKENIVINIPLEWNRIWDTEGIYSVHIKAKDIESAREQTKYTEYKGYGISIFLVLVFALAFYIVIDRLEGYKSFRYYDTWRKNEK